MSDDPADDILELLARDLDGDLAATERRDLYARLARRDDAQALLGRAVALKTATDTLARACEATPTPDMAGWILDAVEREERAANRAATGPRKAGGGLFGALGNALGNALGGRGEGRSSDTGAAGRRLDAMDLMGVVAGTGASPTDDAPAEADEHQDTPESGRTKPQGDDPA